MTTTSPAPAARRLSSQAQWELTEDLLNEIEDFLDADVHPLLIAQTFGRKFESIYKLALNHKRARVQKAFSSKKDRP